MLSNLLYIFNVSCLVLDGVNEVERNAKDTRGSKVNLNTTPLTAEDIWFSAIYPNDSYLQSIFGKMQYFEAIFKMFGMSLR